MEEKDLKQDDNKQEDENKDLTQDDKILNLVQRTMRGDFGTGKNLELILGEYYNKVMNIIKNNHKAKIKDWRKAKII